MSDLHYFDKGSRREVEVRLDELVHRCLAVMEIVFQARYDERRIFEYWLRGVIGESEDPFWILHEHPLYLVADYLGFDPADVDTGPQAQAYLRLARSRNW